MTTKRAPRLHRAVRAGLAALAVTFGAAAAQAAGTPATLALQSTPVYWGTAGTHAVLVLQYDKGATIPLIVKQVLVSAVQNNTQTVTLDNCGTPAVSGGSVVGYSLQPGQHCFVELQRTNGGSFTGQAMITDGTRSSVNMRNNVRAMIEVRDASENVLTHVELR